jgi:hypothetical protein
MVTAAAATATVVAIAVMLSDPGSGTDPLGVAAAQVATGKAGELLEQARQKMILEDAAVQAFTVTSSPKLASNPAPAPPPDNGGAPIVPDGPPPSPASVQAIAYDLLPSYGFSTDQFGCLNDIWTRESDWDPYAENASGAYGIPQALPGDKMASAGPDWQTDPTTQIKWGLGYIQSVYGTPCDAWVFWQAHGWY